MYSTYLGGSRGDSGEGIAVDDAGNAFVLTKPNSADFQVTAGAFQESCAIRDETVACSDAAVTKLNSSATALIYSTFLGGIDNLGGLAVDAAGHAYITGSTNRDFPTTPGAFQTTSRMKPLTYQKAIAAKLSLDGSGLVYSTYLGGSHTEYGYGIAVDPAGHAYVAGHTNSEDFPLVRPIQAALTPGQCFVLLSVPLPCYDGFLAKLNPDGSGLEFSTYFGGARNDGFNGLAIHGSDIYLTGFAGSPDLPTTTPPRTPMGNIMVVKIDQEADAPVFAAASITNAASYVSGVTPGGIGTIFGIGLTATGGVIPAPSLPLPTSLAGVSVMVSGIQAPLLAVANVDGQEQINFVAPWEIGAETEATVQVVNNGMASLPVRVPVLPAQPGLFTIDGEHAAAQHGTDYSLVSSAHPAKPGGIVLLYATGLGAVYPYVPNSFPAPAEPLSTTVETPEVLVGGSPAQVLFSGLAPGYTGLYQLNIVIPEAAASGVVDVVVSVSGQTSKAVKVAVE